MVTQRKDVVDKIPSTEEELGKGTGMWVEGEHPDKRPTAKGAPGGEPRPPVKEGIDSLPPPVKTKIMAEQGAGKDLFDFDIPDVPEYLTFILPSQGVMYGNRKEFSIRPLMTKEEKLMAGLTKKNWNYVINRIMGRAIQEDIDPADLTIGDRLSIIVWLRIQTYSNIYSAKVMCPECEKKTTTDIDLNSLPMETVDEGLIVPDIIELPKTKAKVALELMCNRHEQEVERGLDIQSNLPGLASRGNERWLLRYAATITEIIKPNGEPVEALTLNIKKKFLEKIPPKDFAFIRGWHTKHNHGVGLTFEYECPHCGVETELGLPMELDFFLPTRPM